VDEELRWSDGLAQAELVRTGKASPAELEAEARERMGLLGPGLNALVWEAAPGGALPVAQAAANDAGLPPAAAGAPFAGVPFLVKDLALEIAGTPFREGSRWTEGTVSAHTQELALRHARAGLVTLGKTATCEFGLAPHCEPALHGPVRNPWDPARATSGSSGGSAAAVAAGIVPLAHGGDLGGSIRYPAAWCGVFGFKPSRGLVPEGPEYGDIVGGLAVEHALTRSVRDSAALLDAVAGPAPGDPYAAAGRPGGCSAALAAGLGKLRIAATARPNAGQPVHPAWAGALEETVRLLARLGHTVVEGAPDPLGRGGHRAIRAVYGAAAAWVCAYWTRRTGRTPSDEEIEPYTRALFERGGRIGAGEYLAGVEELQRFARRAAAFFADVDAWLTPTMGGPPVPLGTLTGTDEDPLRGEAAAGGFLMFDAEYANITGGPAMSVPAGLDSEGLPLAVAFLGRPGEDARLMALAAQLEEARPWAHLHPPARGA
jgi:amidase